jgi:hypothetical protein
MYHRSKKFYTSTRQTRIFFEFVLTPQLEIEPHLRGRGDFLRIALCTLTLYTQIHPLVYARVNSEIGSFVIALTTDSLNTFDVSTVRRSVQGMATCPHGYFMNRLLVANRGLGKG